MKIIPVEERCQERVSSGDRFGIFHPYQCEKKAVVVRVGKRYCKIHDPEYIKAKRKARNEKLDKECAERTAQYELSDARKKATEGLSLEELKQVTPDMIRQIIRKSGLSVTISNSPGIR